MLGVVVVVVEIVVGIVVDSETRNKTVMWCWYEVKIYQDFYGKNWCVGSCIFMVVEKVRSSSRNSSRQ